MRSLERNARRQPLLPRALQARALNDTARRYNIGGHTVLSRGIARLATDDVAAILWAVSKFDAFDPMLDVRGDHSLGCFKIRGCEVMFVVEFEVDNRELIGGSQKSAGRTVKIMLVEEF